MENKNQLPDPKTFNALCDEAAALRAKAAVINRELRKKVANAIEDLAIEMEEPFSLPDDGCMVCLSKSEEMDDEPLDTEWERDSECTSITGLRFNDDEGIAEVLEDGWEDTEDDEEIADCAHSIYRLSNYDLVNIYQLAKRACDKC